MSSFRFFAPGALIPVPPDIFALLGLGAVVVAAVLVGAVLLGTGVMVGLLSGGPPLRQLLIGYGTASATHLLGMLCGAALGAWVAHRRSSRRLNAELALVSGRLGPT